MPQQGEINGTRNVHKKRTKTNGRQTSQHEKEA